MTENERAAENLRKFFLAMSEDYPRPAGQAGRPAAQHAHAALHQERGKAPPHRARNDGYLRAAGRAGGHVRIHARMQLLAFEQLEPEAYATITGRLAQIRSSEGGQVDSIALSIKQALAESGLKVEVSGREKHPYSIWKKMAERHVSFEQITDIMAFRVLTEDVSDCYKALGILHRPGR
jgi:guanosine-3',5'-bis(diphosphate) 3'-pyrophosphohydrolase